MTISRNLISAVAAAAAVAKVDAAFGQAFSTGPTATDTYIVESWATLNLPTVPSDNSGDLSLWVGMGTSNGDLIQSIAENYNADDWSVYAYTLLETSATTQEPIQAAGSTADAGAAITFHYKYDSSTGNYTQTVYKGSDVVSTLSTSDGEAEGWGSAVECAAEDCGTVPAHTWTNVSIILNAADESYIDTLAIGSEVDATMTTSDGGITWEVGTISIPCWDFSTEAVCTDSTSSTTTSSAATSSSSAASSSDASPSGTATTGSGSTGSYGSSGSQASGSFGGNSGSSTTSSSGASSSGSFGSFGGNSGSSTSSSAGASTSGTSGHRHGHGSGSSTSGSFGSKSSNAAYSGAFTDVSPSWARSRISRPKNSSN